MIKMVLAVKRSIIVMTMVMINFDDNATGSNGYTMSLTSFDKSMQDFMADVSEIQSKASKLFKEGRNMVLKSYFTQPDAAFISDRMDETEQRLQKLQTNAQKQLHR